jgi:hypothetical protein
MFRFIRLWGKKTKFIGSWDHRERKPSKYNLKKPMKIHTSCGLLDLDKRGV